MPFAGAVVFFAGFSETTKFIMSSTSLQRQIIRSWNKTFAVLVVLLVVQMLITNLTWTGVRAEKDWQLVYKAKSGVPHPDPYDLWLIENYVSLNKDVTAAKELSSTFPGHYKSSLVSLWETLEVAEVKLALYSLGGEEVISFTFRSSVDKWSWFSADNLLEVNPYTNATEDALNQFFSLAGIDGISATKRFIIKPSTSDTCDEIGWITMVTDNGGCRWQSLQTPPFFVYSRKPRPAKWPAWIQDSDTECYVEANGEDYRGQVSTTETGKVCQKWTSQIPHNHTYTPDDLPDTGLGDHNYCRNPDGEEPRTWCYTNDPETRWEYCDIGIPRGGCGRFFDCKMYGNSWVYWNQSCYRYTSKRVSWDEALSRCISRTPQSRIAVVNSEEEASFIQSLLPSNRLTWLGCRADDDGFWTCLDNNDVNMHYYAESGRIKEGFWYWDTDNDQPNGGDENCIVSGSDTFDTQRWHDWPCNGSTKFPVICEAPILSLIEPTYLGCFNDSESRFLMGGTLVSGSMTLDTCFQFCSSLGMRYAGLEYFSECFCGEDGLDLSQSVLRPDSECNSPCSGDNTQICGGAWRLSVYDDILRDDEIGFGNALAISVKLNGPPIVNNCPDDISILKSLEIKGDGIAVFWTEPATDSVTVTVSKTHQPGDIFPVGATQVTYTFADEVTGDVNKCSFIVHVVGVRDELTGFDVAFNAAIALGMILLVVLAILTGMAIFCFIRFRRTKKCQSTQSQEPTDNDYVRPMEIPSDRNSNTTPAPSMPLATGKALAATEQDESTYEELQDRPDKGPYTGLNLQIQPSGKHSQRDDKYDGPEYANIPV